MVKLTTILFILLFSSVLSSFLNVGVAGAEKNAGRKLGGENPFTAKAALIRYWKTQISNDLPEPWFFLNKASPLDAVDLATFSKLADQNSLSTHLHNFCSKANLLCAPGTSESHANDVDFTSYTQRNFSTYGNNSVGGVDSFKNYSSDDTGVAQNVFGQYSSNSSSHSHSFTSYALEGAEADQSFGIYSKSAVQSVGRFDTYQEGQRNPHLEFMSYNEEASRRTTQNFVRYSDRDTVGEQNFKSYDKSGLLTGNNFTTYSSDSDVVTSSFSHYGDGPNSFAIESFSQYGERSNIPLNNFTSYLEEGNGLTIFSNYSDQANIGADEFSSYAKNATLAGGGFQSYGQSSGAEHAVNFTSYGEGSNNETNVRFEFDTYGKNPGFDKYVAEHSFSNYLNQTALPLTSLASSGKKEASKRWVEPGKFFREHMLKPGTVMPMPDIKDKMPQRSFLPPMIATKLPFSSGEILLLREIFHASENPGMAQMIGNALNECERAPSPGETKRCVGSGEEMIDFAKSVLGSNIAVRTTENTHGSNGDILIGAVKAINGGKVTKSISCHQSLYPSLLYYCHSVPKVRVYEADIHDPNSRVKINQGVAICHVDTSSWSAGHAAFLALGPGPGKIEVCHWIFENDLSWAIADLRSDL